jgi:hypothetical protein
VNWFHTICTRYNQIWTNQQFKAHSKNTPRTHGLTRGSATTIKVSYSLLRSPQRDGSFPTLILHKPTTKVKAISSQLSSSSGWYKLLGVVHNLETPKQPLSVKELKVPWVTNPHKIQVCDELERWREKGESRWNQQRVRPTSPHTKGPSINWRRCDFGCERWIECSCLRVGQPRIRGEGRSEWRERECEGYIKEPPKVGGRWGNLTENRLNRFPPGWFSVHWLTEPESGPDPNPVESAQKSVEPIFQQSAHDFF